MLAALLAAIANAAEVIFDKIIVGERNMTGLILLRLQMFFIASWMIVPAILWGHFDAMAFSPKYIGLFLLLLLVGFGHNVLYFSALAKKKVCEVEPIVLLGTPMTIFLAMALLPNERNFTIFVISVIATIALVLSRIEREHLDFDKYSWFLMAQNVFFAIEAIIVKSLLEVSNAFSLYSVRTAILAIIFLIAFRKLKMNKVSKKEYGQTVVNGAITSVQFVARFFAIAMVGVVKSSLIMLLGPVLILVFSGLFLGEKITVKRGVGDAVIIACVAAITLVG